MLILRFVNVGNSRISARDSIVILTLIAWAAIVTSALMVSYDLQIKTWHSWLTFSIILSVEPTRANKEYEKPNHFFPIHRLPFYFSLQ